MGARKLARDAIQASEREKRALELALGTRIELEGRARWQRLGDECPNPFSSRRSNLIAASRFPTHSCSPNLIEIGFSYGSGK